MNIVVLHWSVTMYRTSFLPKHCPTRIYYVHDRSIPIEVLSVWCSVVLNVRVAQASQLYKQWGLDHRNTIDYNSLVDSVALMALEITTRCKMQQQMGFPRQCEAWVVSHSLNHVRSEQAAADVVVESAVSTLWDWWLQIATDQQQLFEFRLKAGSHLRPLWAAKLPGPSRNLIYVNVRPLLRLAEPPVDEVEFLITNVTHRGTNLITQGSAMHTCCLTLFTCNVVYLTLHTPWWRPHHASLQICSHANTVQQSLVSACVVCWNVTL